MEGSAVPFFSLCSTAWGGRGDVREEGRVSDEMLT